MAATNQFFEEIQALVSQMDLERHSPGFRKLDAAKGEIDREREFA